MTSVQSSPFKENVNITTVEMHTGGEPLRIITSGYPPLKGDTMLDKMRYLRENLDHYRKLSMFEPRGHYDMFGALLVTPDVDDADIGVIFMHNEGYGTMCGHGVIALGRYAIDYGLVKNPTSPETRVGIQCPCGLVETFVEYQPGGSGSGKGKTGAVRFHSVPAFLFASDIHVDVPGHGTKVVDVSYGGTFFVLVQDIKVGVKLKESTVDVIVNVADAVTTAVKSSLTLSHPESHDLEFLNGTIITDGNDDYDEQPTTNLCVFAHQQADRSPCGSGVTARVALQYIKGLIKLGQVRRFESCLTGAVFTCKAVKEVKVDKLRAVVVEVSGKAYYTGTNTFTFEQGDQLGCGFLVK